jgi:Fe-S-cluster formation regulator IscX/YfhJ
VKREMCDVYAHLQEMPVSPRVDAQSTLDPELVQRAFQKLQQRIISLEQERHSQQAFNEKQAALLQMLLERVNQAERRLPPSLGSDF